MARGHVARLYHQLSSCKSVSEWRVPIEHPLVLKNFETDVLETFPAHCKTYPAGLPTVELPRSWRSGVGSATAVLAGRSLPPQGALDLAQLARLFHLSAGVLRTAERTDGRYFKFRASGSAGGLFPLELYLGARGVDGLADGVYWFDPLNHALVKVGSPPEGEATTLVVTGIPWRTGWRYAERGFRHLYWDAGAMLANTIALADDAGLDPRLRTVFPDDAVARLVGADGVQEFPLAIVTLSDREPAIRPAGEAAMGAVDRRAPYEFPLITEAQHAGDGERLGAPRPAGAPLSDEPPASAGLDEVILRRISARIMDPSRSVGRGQLEWSLAASLRGCQVPHFLAVHAVEGLQPGLYRWPTLDAPIRRGHLRAELFQVCLDQDLGRDASFVVIAAVDPDQLDDRGYREAQLEAGLVDGRLHLAASALGIGASGMTFLDSEIPRLLGEPLAGLLFTCVGVPTCRHRPGGPPGAPITMRPPTPASYEPSAESDD
jgi:SagB-type dehydrogenase family enzyme